MDYRREVAVALIAFAVGCSGKTEVTPGGGDDGSSSSDAFPASCGPNAFVLRPDAAPNTCAFTPADVACNTNADCSTYTPVSCGCSNAVWGVNKTNTVRCIPPPCPPPMTDCEPDASGLYTEDCQLVPFNHAVVAACVDHRCLSFAPVSK